MDAREIAQYLESLASLPKDPILIPHTNMVAQSSSVTPVPRGSDILFWTLWALHTQTCVQANAHMHKMKEKNKKNK